MNICLKCKNAGLCKSRLKGEDVKECGRFIDATIDWEQRRYEVAKDILAVLLTQPHAMCDNLYEEAVNRADSLIKQLKK